MPRGPQGQKRPPKKLEEHEPGATRDEVMAALKRASQPLPNCVTLCCVKYISTDPSAPFLWSRTPDY